MSDSFARGIADFIPVGKLLGTIVVGDPDGECIRGMVGEIPDGADEATGGGGAIAPNR